MGLQRGRTIGEPPDGDDPDEVTAHMADGRRLVIKGLEPPVAEDDQVEETPRVDVPPPTDDPNRAAVWRVGPIV
jgi:hypothetical protein